MEGLSATHYRQSKVSLALAKTIILELKNNLHEQVLGALVFGSVARQQNTPHSDLDILVVLRETATSTIERVESALSEYDDNVVVQLATPSMLFANLLAKEPFTLTALVEGKVLYDNWLLKPLQEILTRSRILPNIYTAEFLLNRAKKRIYEGYRHLDIAYQHASAAFTDCGFAICHYLGTAPQSLDGMLARLEELQVPAVIVGKVREARISRTQKTDIKDLLNRADDFVLKVEQYLKQQGLLSSTGLHVNHSSH